MTDHDPGATPRGPGATPRGPGATPELVLVLSENWTLTPPADLDALVELAVVAERAGFGAVMLSEHLVLGPTAGHAGPMANPREYALPGNQDPATPWPDSIVLASAVAARTSTMRIALAAIIAPLRHPLALAKPLATLDRLSRGRLVVQPTVSWHQDEYDALGVPFGERGARLDEHLAAWQALWRPGPATFAGRHYRFADVHLEPKPWRPDGPRVWIGGSSIHPAVVRRLADHAHGFHPLGQPGRDELAALREALARRGRDLADLELIGGIRGTFEHPDRPADIDRALARVPELHDLGYTSICVKPSQFIDAVDELAAFCAHVVDETARLTGGA